ncbi:MAG: hypothetical protein PHG66_04685 [Candidatus Colwellbacteria bacterium]|nr:hypothetical protein [Candidatus Colwellbacteria bacterium]
MGCHTSKMINEYCQCGKCGEGVTDCETYVDSNGRKGKKQWFGGNPKKRRVVTK